MDYESICFPQNEVNIYLFIMCMINHEDTMVFSSQPQAQSSKENLLRNLKTEKVKGGV